MAYAKSTVYGKYIKVKSGGSGAAKRTLNYVMDKEKTTQNKPDPGVEKAVDYAANEEKTTLDEGFIRESAGDVIMELADDQEAANPISGKKLVTGLNCDPDNAALEFAFAERLYHRDHDEHLNEGHTANQAFHTILSFKGTDLDPEFVHQLGVEYARRMYGNEYQAVICTHLNTDNYHNHIVSNAYSIDGTHKFQDRFHLYKEIRNIANSISLEYGLPVFVNQEGPNEKRPYRSWKEYSSTAEGKSWKADIQHALDRAIASSSSYNEILEKMKASGYEIQINKRSTTFIKDDVKVRDIRLGERYTRTGIDAALERKEKNVYWEKLKQEMEQTKKQNPTYAYVYIPVYDHFGKRRSFLLRTLLTILELVKQAMDDAYNEIAAGIMEDHIAVQNADKKIRYLEQQIDLVQKYGIQNMDDLKARIRELYCDKNKSDQILESLMHFEESVEPLLNAIEAVKKAENIMNQHQITPDMMANRTDKRTVNRNLAALNPMTAKTRSALYQMLHGSSYRLLRKFDEISQDEANEIASIITEKRRENLPEFLFYGSRPAVIQEESPTKRKPIDLSSMSGEEKSILLDAKEALDLLSKYGLMDMEKQQEFVSTCKKKMQAKEIVERKIKEINTTIRDLYSLKSAMDIIRTKEFVYGIGYTGNGEELDKSLAAILSSRSEFIKFLMEQEQKLPPLTKEQVNSLSAPHPDEFRFMMDCITAGILDKPVSGTKNIHKFILDLERRHVLEQEYLDASEEERNLEKGLEKGLWMADRDKE